jgi:hypothetical protein
MGDTLMSMATEISEEDSNYTLWDKGQLVVILSRTKKARDTIFVGNKHDTLNALKSILMKKTQWCEYMDKVLDVITLNANSSSIMNERQPIQQLHNFECYPFRIYDISLPQYQTGFVYIFNVTTTKEVCLYWSNKMFEKKDSRT